MNCLKALKKSQHAHRGSLDEIKQEDRAEIESRFKHEAEKYPVQNFSPTTH